MTEVVIPSDITHVGSYFLDKKIHSPVGQDQLQRITRIIERYDARFSIANEPQGRTIYIIKTYREGEDIPSGIDAKDFKSFKPMDPDQEKDFSNFFELAYSRSKSIADRNLNWNPIFDADDAVQIALIRLAGLWSGKYEYANLYQRIGLTKIILGRVINNMHRGLYVDKGKNRINEIFLDDLYALEIQDISDFLVGPDSKITQSDANKLIEIFKKLPLRNKLLATLLFSNLTQYDAGEVLEISPNAAKALWNRTINHFRNGLNPHPS